MMAVPEDVAAPCCGAVSSCCEPLEHRQVRDTARGLLGPVFADQLSCIDGCMHSAVAMP